MNTVTTAIKDQSDEYSLKIYHLMNVVKLAAFAAEARRVLIGIDDATHYRPEMRAAIKQSVELSRNWPEMPLLRSFGDTGLVGTGALSGGLACAH